MGTHIHFDNDIHHFYDQIGSVFFWVGDEIMITINWENDEDFHVFISGAEWEEDRAALSHHLKSIRDIIPDAEPLTTPPPPKPHQGDTE
jgi:hypothetical protein